MRILQVTAGLNEGGVERGTLEMAAFIISQGSESIVASNGGKLVAKLKQSGATHIQLPLMRRDPVSILINAIRLRHFIKSNQIDLVHARSRAPAWSAWLACRLGGAKMITTFHGTHKIQNRLKHFYNSSMVRGKRVIAISEFIKTHVIENYSVSESLIDIAPRGFDEGEFNPDEVVEQDGKTIRERLGLSDSDFIITLPGRLTRWKGQTVFLQALAQLKERSWQALIVGGAGEKKAYEQELKALAHSLGISDRVHFLGSQSKIAKFYATSDVVVSASIEPEAFGRVAVEAQAMKKPIIASAHGGSLETVQDGVTGWLYSPDSPTALAEKLLAAIENKSDLNAVGQRARQWVEHNYTINRMCNAEWSAYEKALEN